MSTVHREAWLWEIRMVHVKVVKGHKTMHSMLGNGVFLRWVNQSTGSGGAPGMMNDADVSLLLQPSPQIDTVRYEMFRF